uniref:Uncharacterized protein n=1 Tax=Meloidogyne enterolobii TaxID=390850 RepID=A0A6V7Y187_MELEN|nr:unnamed protein product [Meloidogyne enterolobii]
MVLSLHIFQSFTFFHTYLHILFLSSIFCSFYVLHILLFFSFTHSFTFFATFFIIVGFSSFHFFFNSLKKFLISI